MTGSYKRFDQINPSLFDSLIRASRMDDQPEGTDFTPTGLMSPQTGVRQTSITPEQQTETTSDSILTRAASAIGAFSTDPDLVASTVIPQPRIPQEVDLSEWESMPPVRDIIGPSQTEQAIPTLPSSMGITAPTQYVPANIDFTEGAEPISAPEISRVDDATFDRYTRTTSAGSRQLEDIEGVVLHYTHGSPRGSSVETFMDVGFNRGRGAPFFIDRDGTIHEVGDWRNSIIQHTSRASGIGTYRAPSGERFSSTNTVGIEIDVGWDWANDRPLEGAAGQPTEAQLNAIRYLTNNVIDEVNAVRPDDLQLDINRSVYAHPELGRKKPTEGTYALQWLREQEGLPATRDVEWYMDNRGQERIRINRSIVPRPRPTGEGSSKQTTEKGEAGKQTTAKDAGSGDAFVVSAIDQVLRNEGGYQRNRGDRGNYRPDGTLVGTNRGITALALAQYRGVDANSITAQDIQGVTEEEARAIYRQNYYERPRIDELPANIRENVFDMYVNSYTNAIKILQRLVGVEEDGYIGTDTLNALEEANITNDDYSDAREAYYRAIVENDPTQRENLRGWINRANKYRD
jgi:hypothetical protein